MERLDKLVESFGNHDSEFKELKTVCEEEKKELKSLMEKEKVDAHSAGGYKVSRSVSERTTMNEEMMLAVLKKDWVTRYGSMDCPYIKTKEYVDMDILESVIYAGDLSKETLLELDKCKTVTEVVTLRCSKAK